MNRAEYMSQLEGLLKDISPAERVSALEYYNDYFDDAGPENEQAVMEALGSPARVAETIREEVPGNDFEGNARQAVPEDRAVIKYGQSGRYTQSGSDQQNGHNQTDQTEQYRQADQYQHTHQYQQADQHQQPGHSRSGMSGGTIAVIVILCVLASPVIFTLATGIGGVLFGIVVAWFCLILGFGLAAAILLMVMVILLVVGIAGIMIAPAGAIGVIGGALICGGLGLVFLMLTVAMAGIVVPAAAKGIASLFRKIFGRRKASV